MNYDAPPPYSDPVDRPHQQQQPHQIYHGTVPQGTVVCYGNHIALKHNMTGRYLSSRDRKYATGSGQQEVFANRWHPDPSHDFWIVIPALNKHHQPGDPVQYNHIIRLKHTETRRNLHSHQGFRSPITGQQEVTAFGDDDASDENDHWRVERFGYQEEPQHGGV
ncbi:hypothetical protein BC937DRAFT_94813 [Endogone sp. FLAS-F59071]|nr:hypothetical protein BC937DRAFT_94813 [Endogone sp. FLAS-F59071]|eukprot:RUS13769.1 hypothetical protein BC937DRAFT_94813 [Endogone sp. FLAS-F59071]